MPEQVNESNPSNSKSSDEVPAPPRFEPMAPSEAESGSGERKAKNGPGCAMLGLVIAFLVAVAIIGSLPQIARGIFQG